MDNRPMHHGMADYEFCAIDPNSIRVFGRKLARTERPSGKELRAYQAPVLARLLAHARQTTDFYKDRLEFDQVVQTDFDHVEIRYVPEPAAPPVDLSVVTQRIRSALRQPVDVTVRAAGAIQRSRNGKHEDFISLVPTG